MSSDEPVKFTQAEALNDHEIIVSFSDNTTVVLSVAQILAIAPERDSCAGEDDSIP